jgi:hypothetical protein
MYIVIPLHVHVQLRRINMVFFPVDIIKSVIYLLELVFPSTHPNLNPRLRHTPQVVPIKH